MCGIFCTLSGTHPISASDELQARLENRGPDSARTIHATYPKTLAQEHDTSTPSVHVTITSTVLSLRGSRTVVQPCQDNGEEFTLCWNGEAWSIGGEPPAGNDTEAIHDLLVNALKTSSSYDGRDYGIESASKVAEALSQVAGPYAFVFFDQTRGHLFLGRDFLGRRSLLKRITDAGDLLVSSVSDGDLADGWEEIEADGVYCVDLHIADPSAVRPCRQIQKWGRFVAGSYPYSFTEAGVADTNASGSVIPCLSLIRNLPRTTKPLTENSPSVATLQELLRDSLSLRVRNIPGPPSHDVESGDQTRSRLAILFSGGLDCTVLARISHDLLPRSEPIDLLNVAFENPRIHRNADSDADAPRAYELCPDRITGRASYEELMRVCPDRQWRFIAINIPYTETLKHREKVISLMHPHNTEMDLSIAYALYFAARGQGHTPGSPDQGKQPYTTSARVLLSGLGADELFGGYTRHATAFKRNGFLGLLDELELDVSRLGKRNLGRDDRVMSHWSKEVRFPYLDEKLLGWALNAPVMEKCGFGEASMDVAAADNDETEVLEAGKKVLRCLAWKVGMEGVAKEKKRAIQFGARTAKMETGKTKGTQLLS